MTKALKCTGYAIGGAVAVFAIIGVVFGYIAVCVAAVELVNGFWPMTNDTKGIATFTLSMGLMGAVGGAFVCHQRNR